MCNKGDFQDPFAVHRVYNKDVQQGRISSFSFFTYCVPQN